MSADLYRGRGTPRAERFNPDAFKKDVIWGHLSFMYAASPPWVPEVETQDEDRPQSRARHHRHEHGTVVA